jgi:DNA (cytosine-5)-methyltransferase 1
MENVPDMLNYGGKNIAEEIAGSLDDLGYECRYTILNAAHYGVPQFRQRVIVLAFLKALAIPVTFPSPSTHIVLPDGYADARQSALGTLHQSGQQLALFGEQALKSHYVSPPDGAKALPAAVTAGNALGDLPPLFSREISRGVKRFNTTVHYPARATLSEYARQMRTWPGFEACDGLSDHVTRYLTRDYRIFKKMRAGDEYPRALHIARQLFKAALGRLIRRRGSRPHGNNKEYRNLRKRYVPPYDSRKFPNKWCKMDRDRPARTLTAHLGKDTYTHIHYDSKQSRTITVREAARLQSFPDGFKFEGPMNPAFRQIGNAVPPLLAFAVADHIQQVLLSRSQQSNERAVESMAAQR